MKRILLGLAIVLILIGIFVKNQLDFATFVSRPYIERAEHAAAQQNWPEVIRNAEYVLRRFGNNAQARRLLALALVNERQYELAESVIIDLGEQAKDLLFENRQNWAAEATPSDQDFIIWFNGMDTDDWIALAKTGLFQRERRDGRNAALNMLESLLQEVDILPFLELSLDFLNYKEVIPLEKEVLLRLENRQELAAEHAIRLAHLLTDDEDNDEIARILQNQQAAAWFQNFREAHIDRLVGANNLAAAIDQILSAWSWQEMPEDSRNRLVQLAFLDENFDLIARQDLRAPDLCLDSVGWLGERSPMHAESLLLSCDQTQDPERWNFLASLYAPEHYVPPVDEEFSILEADYAEQLRLLEEAEAELALRQIEQDALDAAWEGICPEPDQFSQALLDELLALCLSRTMPGVSTIYFERTLQNDKHPRLSQLLRAAGYSSYDAGDYELALEFWDDLSEPFSEDDLDAIAATEAAREMLLRRNDERPLLTLDELLVAAVDEPLTYSRELGMRLSGHDDREVRLSAIAWLEQGRIQAPHDFRLPEALAYRYYESGDSNLALISARAAIDSMDPNLAVGTATPDELGQRFFNLRRTHQFLTQRNRVYFASTLAHSGVPTAIGTTQAANGFNILSFEHLLGDEPTVSGRQLGVYLRALSSEPSRQQFFSAPAYGIGARWKPLGNHDINTYAELYFSPDGEMDLMFRLAGSFLNKGNLRDDWRASENQWAWQVLYLDGAYLVDNSIYQFFGSYQLGRDFKLSPFRPHTLAPYVTSFRGQSNGFSDTALGAGLRYRLWFSEDLYSAWRNRVDLRVEVNQSISGFQKGARGMRMLLEWQL